MDNLSRGQSDDDGRIFQKHFGPFVFESGQPDALAKRDNSFDERIGEAKAEIKQKKKFASFSDVDMFLSRYSDIASRSSTTSGNLLHALVEVVKYHADVISSEDVERLVRRLVQDYPDLLRYPNKENQNPVYMAIRAGNDHMINCMLPNCARSYISITTESFALECLDEALRARGQEGQSSLHLAFNEDLEANTIKRLVEYASDDALAEQDDMGKTPLHHAVSFSRCSEDARVELIEAFIQRDLRAIQNRPNTFLDLSDRKGRSVYQEHENTRDCIVQMQTNSLQARLKAQNKQGPEDQTIERSSNTSVKRSNTARVNEGLDPEKFSDRPTQDTTPKQMDLSSKCYENSQKLLLMLKLHYMRTRSAERVISFVHGTNMSDTQISFDYDGLPRKLIWNEFIKLFGADSHKGLKLDKVLQNVTFPYVEVKLKGRLADIAHDSEQRSGVRQLGGLGRKDMKYFFDWLYAKGVRRILNVTVKELGDSGKKAHSDKAIQESLDRFVIEHLDWQKKDLDPETILCVSSRALEKQTSSQNPDTVELHPDRQLKELSLRWGGSNAVLRAWSEPEGLAMLPRLQKVYLYKPPSDKTFDNLVWIDRKVREFQLRLNNNVQSHSAVPVTTARNSSQKVPPKREIEVIVRELEANDDEGGDSNLDLHANSTKSKGSHRWLDCTSRFAGEMLPFWKDTLKDFNESSESPTTEEGVEKDVIVALIDDGIDIFDTTLSNQVLEGKSFDFHDGKVRPPFSSASGHGTVMANMILRVCPMAKIYPIRLKTYNIPEGKSQIDRDYAAQAVRAALDKEATIISMSWILPMPPRGMRSEDKLHEVLQDAVDRKVLMFCSSPDEGNFKDLDYPSGPWRDRFFRIGAAGADGRVFAYTPDDGITFILPGVEVVKDLKSTFESAPSSGITGRVMDFKYETGSSVATALAAGLAAMIIYCVKASILSAMTANQNKPVVGAAIPKDGATLVAEHDAMQQAFRSLGTVTSSNFVQVWEELDKVSEMLENARGRPQTLETKRDRTESFVEFGKKLAKSVRRD